ncbi:MAG: hypothetical protein CEE43_04865 [Promethearchaeota archaeon Loki_b32]|nr:MAG: hypothetical protein CEE43_04865 [Candidatus Lokiarchaeota archaeon Loki_b32]
MIVTEQNELNLTYKICIFGDSGVGKTTIVNRYLTNNFLTNIKSTLGAAIHIKYVDLDKGKATLQVWDFGGEEKFKFLISSYAQGASGGIFMFDLTNYDSLINVINWHPEFRKIARRVPLIMVGSKLDLEEKRICREEDAIDIMQLYKFHNYIECSSKTGENVELVFKDLLLRILSEQGYAQIKLI